MSSSGETTTTTTTPSTNSTTTTSNTASNNSGSSSSGSGSSGAAGPGSSSSNVTTTSSTNTSNSTSTASSGAVNTNNNVPAATATTTTASNGSSSNASNASGSSTSAAAATTTTNTTAASSTVNASAAAGTTTTTATTTAESIKIIKTHIIPIQLATSGTLTTTTTTATTLVPTTTTTNFNNANIHKANVIHIATNTRATSPATTSSPSSSSSSSGTTTTTALSVAATSAAASIPIPISLTKIQLKNFTTNSFALNSTLAGGGANKLKANSANAATAASTAATSASTAGTTASQQQEAGGAASSTAVSSSTTAPSPTNQQATTTSTASISSSSSASSTTTTTAIKLTASSGGPNGTTNSPAVTSLGCSTAIAITTSNAAAAATTSASIRAIGAGGQSTQVRVVMPTSMMVPSMIKQLENAGGRTQITAFPAAPVPRTISNTSITVTRPVTQTTYLPRASVTAAHMTGVTAGGQRLVTPVRAATGATITGAGSTVTGLTTAGSFVRGTAVSCNTASPGTTVISPATNTTWMTANTGQVQLIRTIPQPTRQRIITTQGITTVGAGALVGGGNGTSTVTTVSGAVAVAAGGNGTTGGANAQNQSGGQQSTIQIVSSPTSVAAHVSQQQQQQQTYVATLSTVLPQRPHQATLVYSSNVGGATAQAISQAQQFNPAVGTTQRFAVATPLTTTTVGGAGAPRQIRPIPLAKSFSTAKLNTTSISIRAPNLPQLTPTIATSVAIGGAGVVAGSGGAIATIAGSASNSPRSNAVTVPTASVIPTANLSTTRIIQLQQPPSGTTQQIISSTGRLTGNVMLQPIIVNTSAGGKIGIRPPVTMATKVQPSLTITQLGISKLPQATATGNAASANATGNSGTSSGSASPSISTAASVATNLTTNATAAQLLSAQQIVSSAATATVVPLAITTRGANGSSILTGTITPIKNANGITVGKVMTPAATATVVAVSAGGGAGTLIDATSSASTVPTAATTTPSSSAATSNVYIHQRPNSSIAAVSSVAGGPTTVLSTTGTPTSSAAAAAAAAFLTPGTIYYESVPASSVQVSTGVLSLTTTTVTSSTITSSASNLTAINTLPFVSNANGGATAATFTVVPSTGGRTIGQLQVPISTAAGAQLAAVPVRFSTQLPADAKAGGGGATTTTATAHLLQSQQLIMPVPTSVAAAASQAQMVIPLQTSIKVSAAGGGGGGNGTSSAINTAVATPAAIVPNFIRKRDGAEVSGLRAAKNLGPTLLSMSSASHSSSGAGSPVSVGNVGNCYSLSSAPSSGGSGGGGGGSGPFSLTVEALAKKERAAAASGGGNGGSCATIVSSSTRSSRVASPASSDGGSTTVSAHSSPGVEQQMQDGNMIINRMTVANDNMHFNPINELYANHPSVSMQHQLASTSGSSRNSSLDQQQHHQLHGSPIPQRLNGAIGPIDCPPRKKSRRSTNDSQQSVHSQTSLNLPPPSSLANPLGVQLDGSGMGCVMPMGGIVGCGGLGVVCHGVGGSMVSGDLLMAATSATQMSSDGINLISHNHGMPPGNKENAKPTEYVLRRPRNCTLLNGYKQTGKITNNHFQRYSDVKPRKPNPSVIDLANQPNILAKINGWKIYHLQSQMMDLCDDENTGYEKLSEMLKSIETHEQSSDIERICDLIKGNMQRSKIIVDGVNEAQNQIMKIFDHKTHVSDIINRCASKRNFKKRDKV